MDEASRIRAVYAAREASSRYAPARYSPFRSANLYLLQRLERGVLGLLRREGITSFDGLRILDIGCGDGSWLRRFVLYGADPSHVSGIDLRPDALDEARRLGPTMDLREGNATELPWKDSSFEVVTQFTVFSSVLHAATRDRMAAEVRRVLTPGGLILWYDMTMNPTNPNVIGLGKNDVRALFPNCAIRFQISTLAPPLGDLVAPISWTAARLLESLPPLRTHLLAAIRPPDRA